MMFAQMPALNFTQIGMGCVALAAVAVLINQLFKLRKNAVGFPPAGELQGQVMAVAERVSKLEGEKLIADARRKAIYEKMEGMGSTQALAMDRLRNDLMHEMTALRKENKDDNCDLHERVNDVLKAVSKLEGRLQA